MKRFIAVAFVTGLLTLLGMGQPAQQATLSLNEIIELDHDESASTELSQTRYEGMSSYLSPVYESEFPFQLLALSWEEELTEDTAASMEIRFRDEDDEWTTWQDIHEDQDDKDEADTSESYFITETSVAFQYRVLLTTFDTTVTPRLSDFTFEYVNGGEPSALNQLAKLTFNNNSNLISRSSWGANESIRLLKNHRLDEPDPEKIADAEERRLKIEKEDSDMVIVKRVEDRKGEELLWPEEYPKKVKKIVIHHTATTKDLNNPKAAIRAIYQYHAVSRGWGDIGYNYIIDREGNIYEGRSGGEGVVAGHAAGFNTGTIGIALLGNYENEPVPAPMMKALVGLIQEKSNLHNIDPDAFGQFRGEVIPNILTHRELSATACPGDFAYDFVDEIRSSIGHTDDNRRHTNNREDFAYQEVGDRELITLNPNNSKSITVKIKNTGTKRWTKDTFLTINADHESEQVLAFKKDSLKRVATMKESFVDPGKIASFSFEVEAQMSGGFVHFDMAPVFNGNEKTRNTMDLAAYVEQPFLDFDVLSRKLSDELLKPGEHATVTLKLKNTGNLVWKNSGDNKIELKRAGNSSLVSTSRLASLKEREVKPGQIGTFEFKVKAPSTGGKYSLSFKPVMQNSNALSADAGRITVQVLGSSADASVTDMTEDSTFKPGENKAVWIRLQNSSNLTWKKSDLEFGVTKNSDIKMTNPRMAVRTLAPGVSTKISFSVTAPETPGTYTIYLRPRLNKQNLSDEAIAFTFTVEKSDFKAAATYENPIRIKLTPDMASDSHILTSSRAFSIYNGTSLQKTLPANSRVRVQQLGSQLYVSSGANKWTLSGPVRLVPSDGGITKVLTMDQRPGWNKTLNDNQFRGILEVQLIKGDYTLINELPLEDYLRGVGEVSNNDPQEKIKTIQTLARSYAWYYMTQDEKFPGMPYHLDDDPNTSQKYLGYGYEKRSPKAIQALEENTGRVVTYNGKVVKTPYFSKSDGKRTKSAQSVWGWNNTPWLVSVDDSHCTVSSQFEGHGVGLSGCGATQMAIEGKTYEEIIRYYFSGVELSSL